MILTDIELRAEIKERRLVFEPPIEPGQINTCTIDLRLGRVIKEFVQPQVIKGVLQETIIDPSDLDFAGFFDEYTREVNCSAGYYDLKRETPVLARTLERVTLPSHLCGRVEGRSGLARLGLTVHNTAPFVHPGFSNHIALELHYTGHFPLRLRIGDLRICQLIVERVSGIPRELYRGRWQGQ